MSDVLEIIPRDQATPPYFLGIDVGGTGIKFGLVDDLGRTLGRSKIATQQERGPEDACQRMRETSHNLVADCGIEMRDVVHVGLATPGTMDIFEGRLLQPHNLPAWWDFPIRDHLSDVMSKPVAFQNDANAAAFGEFWIGSGADYNSMVLFTLGTGVGGGIIVDGRLINGEHSHGSECGHTYIDTSDQARDCGCGRRGHLEAYASATAVVDRTQEAMDAGEASSIQTRLAEGERLTSLMVAEEAERGDALSLRIVMETADYLSYGAVNMMHIIDPNAIIFGGAMDFGGHETELGRKFLAAIRKGVEERVFPGLSDKTIVDFASLGGDAGYIGSAAVARREYLDRSRE